MTPEADFIRLDLRPNGSAKMIHRTYTERIEEAAPPAPEHRGMSGPDGL
jgi:hypothetical protein